MTSTSRDQIVVLSMVVVAAFGTPIVYGVVAWGACGRLKPEPQASRRRLPRPDRILQMRAPLRSQRRRLKQMPWRLRLRCRLGRWTPMSQHPFSTSSASSERATRLSPGGLAPGAIVELLLNGGRRDQAVANESGQFVMVPPQFSPGDYELTLRSRQPDGGQATSKQSVVIVVNEVGSDTTGTVRAQPEVSPRIR
jgi:hypothetical protein